MKVIGSLFMKLGKSLMLPIAVLPIAGILMRLGQPDVLNILFIADAGSAVFQNMPVIFAIGVGIGFSDDQHGAAALAAFIGHAIFTAGMKALAPDINMGVFSGIIMGATAGILYNKFKNIQLPVYLAFFGGRRFVPIITGLTAIILAFIFSFTWVPVDKVIAAFGKWITESGNTGIFTYGVANRLLIPFGLHQIINSLVWFQFGDYATIKDGAQVVLHGDIWRFFAGDPAAGNFMTLFFPVMMFGLPGGAVAMILAAKPGKRKNAAGILLSAAFIAFLTGITEPLEFSFMFLAFPLYAVHALLTGLSGIIVNTLNMKLGFTFSAGLFDYILGYGISTHPLRLIPVGIFYFLLYFVIFYFSIKFWNIKTIGREDDEPETAPLCPTHDYGPKHELYEAAQYVAALGGKNNIKKLTTAPRAYGWKLKIILW